MPLRKGRLIDERTTIIGAVRCVSALQVLVDLAAHLDDDRWEQALESALRKRSVIELDGQSHKDQPVYDAHRQTAVVAATGWHVARFTWREVTRAPRTCVRRLLAIVERLAA